MKNRPSIYTPSNTDPEFLERIFVQRRDFLERLVSRYARNLENGTDCHTLLIGPRGTGKTCLLHLFNYRLSGQASLAGKTLVAWLGEDDVLTSLIDIALGVADQLARKYPEEFGFNVREKIRGLEPDAAAQAALRLLVEKAGDRTLLVMTENLDRTLHHLEDLGRKRLRAFLQENRQVSTLTTSQQLFEEVGSRDEAFFGFFDVHHLEALDIEQAQELLQRISREQGNQELADYVRSVEGRYRVRALHHLAGGNHRMYVMLSEFLSKDSLDDLVAAFDELADEMTPFFQERLLSLPPQQAKIVQCLCNTDASLTVKAIAQDLFIPDSTCSKQLSELKKKRYVIAQKRGKFSYYEMAEPLMRLCLQVKNQRGTPLKLVVKFLRAWFPESRLRAAHAENSVLSKSQRYCTAALAVNQSYAPELTRGIRADIDRCKEVSDLVKLEKLSEELRFAEGMEPEESAVVEHLSAPQVNYDLSQGLSQIFAGEFENAISSFSAVLELDEAPTVKKAVALLLRGTIYAQNGDSEDAIADYSRLIEMDDAPAEEKAMALFNRGAAYSREGETEKAIADYSRLIEMDDAPTEEKAKALLNRGITYFQLGETEKEMADYSRLIDMDDAPDDQKIQALNNLGSALWRQGEWTSALARFDEVIASYPEEAGSAHFARVECIIPLKGRSEARTALEHAFRIADRKHADFGGWPKDVLAMVLNQAPQEWKAYIEDLGPLYIQGGVAEKLGAGIVGSIQLLDTGEFSSKQRANWNDAWQAVGRDCPELQLPLRCLQAATEVMDTGKDESFFQLAPEIREVVKPLLSVSLPQKE